MNILLRLIDFIRIKFGIDRAIFFVLIGRGTSLLSQPITLLFITRFLTPVEQGFYFTFASIVFLSIFLELGLGTIITQFASYEFAHLKWTTSHTLEGDTVSLHRLVSLGERTIKWYLVISFLFASIIIPVGLYFFKSQGQDVYYQLPWICLVIFSAINLVIYSFTSILEGCDRVADVQRMKMVQSIVGNIIIWILLFSDAGLFAAAALTITQCVLSLVWLRIRYFNLIRQIYALRNETVSKIEWRKEILPLQWKIGLSWISGYVVSESINPILFKYRGAVEAGQMGMTRSIANVAAVVGLAWITAKYPTYGSLIRLNKLDELSRLVKQNSTFAIMASFITAILLFFLVMGVTFYLPDFNTRFLGLNALMLLLAYNLVNLIPTCIATYLRAFKQEPFLLFSLIGACLTGAGVFLSAKFASAETLCVTILCINLFFSMPYSIYILYTFDPKQKTK